MCSCCLFNSALGRWVKWQKYNRTLRDRGESSVLDKRRIKLLNAIDFDWGYQRVPPKVTGRKANEKNGKPKSSNTSVNEMKPAMSKRNEPFRHSINSALVSHEESMNVAQKGNNFLAGIDVTPEDDIMTVVEEQVPFVDSMRCNQVSPSCHPKMSVRDEISPTTVMNEDVPSFSTRSFYHHEKQEKYIQHRSNYSRDHFQSNVREYYADSNEERIVSEECYQAGGNSGFSNETNAWTCSVCRFATFRTYNEALIHENSCLGLFDNFSFCQSCTYY